MRLVAHSRLRGPALVVLATFLFVCAVLWTVFRVLGVPGFLPDGLTQWLQVNAGL